LDRPRQKIILSFAPSDIPDSPEWFYPEKYNEPWQKKVTGEFEFSGMPW
jgi:hypothetical protein